MDFKNRDLLGNEAAEIIASITEDSKNPSGAQRTNQVNLWKHTNLYPKPTMLEISFKKKQTQYTNILLISKEITFSMSYSSRKTAIHAWENESEKNKNMLVL